MQVSASRKIYSAPWIDLLPDGNGIEYGPSPKAHARELRAYALWSWRPGERAASKLANHPIAAQLLAYMRPDGTHLRSDVPRRETEIYLLVFEHGNSVRHVARTLEITRSSVRVYLRRLVRRAMGGK